MRGARPRNKKSVDKEVRNRYVSQRVHRHARRRFEREISAGAMRGRLRRSFALVDHDGFGEAVLRAHSILAPEKLQEAEAAFEHGGAIAQRSFDRLPKSEAMLRERNGARARYPFAGRAAVADVVGEAEVEQKENEIACLVEIPDDVDLLLVEDFDAPENLHGRPEDERDEEIDGIAQQPLPEGGERQAVELLQARGFMRAKEAPCGASGGFVSRCDGHGRDWD